MVRATRLRTNALVDPLGLDDPRPEFSWRLDTDDAGDADVIQAAYAVQVALDGDFDGDLAWDSGRVTSDLPFGIRYAGAPLRTCRRYDWRVRLWDSAGDGDAWSAPATFETGFLDASRCTAAWISGPPPGDANDDAVLYLRGDLELPATAVRARAYASALGWYRLFINGIDITGDTLVPRFTPFDEVVEYQAYDVTDALREGGNIVAIAVGDGRFRGRLGVLGRRNVYGSRLAGLLQLELELADGSAHVWTTGPGWLAGPGRITGSDPKDGERADLRVPDDDWLRAPQAPARLRPAEVLAPHRRRLIGEEVPRVGEVARLPAAKVWRAPSGRQLVDFGQNTAGIVRIRLTGAAGTTVRLAHSELLTPAGELDTGYLTGSKKGRRFQCDDVILDGAERWYQPWFTIHGFRYVEVDGLPGDLGPNDIEAVVVSSRLDAAGSVSCSDERLTRLFQNVVWSTRSNFTDTPTDCPTRERSGWTGDIQVFAPTATGVVDAQAFLRRYLRNLALDQLPDGRVPPFIPSETSTNPLARRVIAVLANSVGWGDVAVRTPWDMYRYYGDRTVLQRQYPSMRAWVDHMERTARTKHGLQRRFSPRRVGPLERYVLDAGFHWGEWLRPGEGFTGHTLHGPLRSAVVATAYYASSARLLARIAAVLGNDTDADRYRELAENVRRAWQAAFIRPDGRIGTDRQDDYVRALAFGLLPADQRARAAARLVELIEQAGNHLGTGFLSTPMLLHVLVDTGHTDVAFRLLLQNTCPSWLYQVEHGATTIWETWEGYTDDGRGHHSHNHYAFGSVACWLREYLVGIRPVEPGYRRILVAPTVGGGLRWAEGSVDTPFGWATSRWELDDTTGRLEVRIPPGTHADVRLPDGTMHHTGSGRHAFDWRIGLTT